MGFWHTGYMDFHQHAGLDEYVYQPAPPTIYVCEQCGQQYPDIEGLRRHRFEQHPLRQPSLLVRGRAVGQLTLTVMTPLRPSDVVAEDSTYCKVKGQAIAPELLGACLAEMTHEFVDIELGNQGTITHCKIDFRIAGEADLLGVEAAFIRMARDRVLSLDAVSRFITDCRGFASATPYCDGICQYLYGVMAKEKSPDSGLPPERYVEKFSQAAETLAGFDRPLAGMIRALVAFHFNHFADAESLAPEGRLRHVSRSFIGVLHGSSWQLNDALVTETRADAENLLTDQDTLQVLADAGQDQAALQLQAGELQDRLRRVTSEYDRLKRALLAAEALAACADLASHEKARRLARAWVGVDATNQWAEALLERLGTP